MDLLWFRKLALLAITRARHRLGSKRSEENLISLRNSEKLNYHALLRLQKSKLQDILLYSWHNVPYYKRLFDEIGIIKSNSEIDLSRFQEIPLLDKEIINNSFSDLKSKKLAEGEYFYNTSGGSTGEPVKFVQDAKFAEWGWAVKTYFDEWSGYYTGRRKIKLWGSERDLFVGRQTAKIRLLRWLHNEIWLNAFKMTSEQMRNYVEKINTFKPVQILAYVESIYELSLFIEKEKILVHSPKAIMTSAGTLYSYMKDKVQNVFQAPVYNRYGSREVGDMACECEQQNGLHVSSLTHYIEILNSDLNPAGPDENGEIVVTSLSNFAMPLIRYRVGDIGAWSKNPCTCGRPFPLLKRIEGRVSDTFFTKGGDQVHGEYFTHLFYFREWIKKFQVVQEELNLVKVLIVSKNLENSYECVANDLADIQYKIQLVMGNTCKVEFKFVNEIVPSKSGKYRYTISKLSIV